MYGAHPNTTTHLVGRMWPFFPFICINLRIKSEFEQSKILENRIRITRSNRSNHMIQGLLNLQIGVVALNPLFP